MIFVPKVAHRSSAFAEGVSTTRIQPPRDGEGELGTRVLPTLVLGDGPITPSCAWRSIFFCCAFAFAFFSKPAQEPLSTHVAGPLRVNCTVVSESLTCTTGHRQLACCAENYLQGGFVAAPGHPAPNREPREIHRRLPGLGRLGRLRSAALDRWSGRDQRPGR